MKWKKWSDSRWTARSSRSASARATVVFPAPGGPVRISTSARFPRLMIYDKDADLAKLDGRTVAVLGYGSQGHAHALNLKDSGVDVVVGLREDSSSVEKAKGDGLRVTSIADAASEGDVVMILLPDEKQAEVW